MVPSKTDAAALEPATDPVWRARKVVAVVLEVVSVVMMLLARLYA